MNVTPQINVLCDFILLSLCCFQISCMDIILQEQIHHVGFKGLSLPLLPGLNDDKTLLFFFLSFFVRRVNMSD